MRQPLFALAAAMSLALPLGGGAIAGEDPLKAAIAATTRTPSNITRDSQRHPAETLRFFGLKPGQSVVEIWPGGGWYTEILAPYAAKTNGRYYAAAPERGLAGAKRLAAANPDLYGKINFATFPAGAADTRVPDGSADLVLTFRNVHNWRMGEQDVGAEAFRQMFAMLKPGGTLGVVEHRLPETADSARERTSGYTKVSTVRQLAEAAGFQFDGESKVNFNRKDTADWPDGVWTLPPTLALKDKDRDKYIQIGESDRMTLRFRKPK